MCANLVRAGFDVAAFDFESCSCSGGGRSCGLQVQRHSVQTEAVQVTRMWLSQCCPPAKHVKGRLLWKGWRNSEHAPEWNALFIDCSTIAVNDARDVISAGEASKEFEMVDAPVSGGVAAAAGWVR